MRSRNRERMEQIKDFIESYYLQNGTMPSTTDIADHFSMTRASAYRYLVYMDEDHLLSYKDGIIETPVTEKYMKGTVSVPIVGTVPCGDPTLEEENVEEYVSLPQSIFGKGDYFLLHAAGDSMTDAGISEGDLIVIERKASADMNDIVVALDENNENTLKKYSGIDKKTGEAVLSYMNRERYPGKEIRVQQLTVQGVARKVIKSL